MHCTGLDDQKLLFDYFFEIFAATVRLHKSKGDYSEGLVEMKADGGIHMIYSKVVHTCPISGAPTSVRPSPLVLSWACVFTVTQGAQLGAAGRRAVCDGGTAHTGAARLSQRLPMRLFSSRTLAEPTPSSSSSPNPVKRKPQVVSLKMDRGVSVKAALEKSEECVREREVERTAAEALVAAAPRRGGLRPVVRQEYTGFWVSKGTTTVDMMSKSTVLVALEVRSRWRHVSNRNRSFRVMRPNNGAARPMDLEDLQRT